MYGIQGLLLLINMVMLPKKLEWIMMIIMEQQRSLASSKSVSCNSFTNLFCAIDNLLGIITSKITNILPFPMPLTFLTPLPLSLTLSLD